MTVCHVREVVQRLPTSHESLFISLAQHFVAVILEASHTCMTMRGIRKGTSICTTSAMRGTFAEKESTRAELMSLIYGSR